MDATVRERIRTVGDPETLKGWYDEAVVLRDVQGAERLVETIRKVPLF